MIDNEIALKNENAMFFSFDAINNVIPLKIFQRTEDSIKETL
jgi:hypothetical protein